MKRKDYLSPAAEMTVIRFETSFCTSGQASALSDFDLLDPDVEWE